MVVFHETESCRSCSSLFCPVAASGSLAWAGASGCVRELYGAGDGRDGPVIIKGGPVGVGLRPRTLCPCCSLGNTLQGFCLAGDVCLLAGDLGLSLFQ